MLPSTIDPTELLVAEGLVNVPEAARFLHLSRSTIYSLMEAGKLPYIRIGRSRRIPRRSLMQLAVSGLVLGGGA